MKFEKPAILIALALLVIPVLATAATLHQGTWTKARAKTEGGWQIVEANGGVTLVLDQHFATKKAPDLKLFLVPRPASELTNDNVLEGAVRLGKLVSPKGRQEYRIPAGTDLSRFETLVLHCEKYSELWSTAALE